MTYNDNTDTDLVAQIKKLNDRVERLERAPRAVAMGIDSGSIDVVDSSGIVLARIGAMDSPSYDKLDGSRQPGIVLRREDNSVAMILGDLNPSIPPFQQALQVFDRNNHIIVADDTNSGIGLARPHLPLNLPTDGNQANWPATTSAAYVAIAQVYFERQNPLLQWKFWCQADAGTTGDFAVFLDGTQLGSNNVITATTSVWTVNSILIPGTIPYGNLVLFELKAKRTAGAGTIRSIPLLLQGVQS